MGRALKAKRTTGAAAVAASSPQLRKTNISPSYDSFSSSSASSLSSSSLTPSQLVRDLKQLWGRCTAAATPGKLLLAAERLFERLSFALEQRGLTYPAEVVVQQEASCSEAAAAAGAAAAGAAAAGAAAAAGEAAARPWTEGGEEGLSEGQGGGLSSGSKADASTRTEEEKLCEWLQAAAKQFLLLLCELLDAEAEELQQGGLSFCMRIVAHTHRVQAAAALRTSSFAATAAGPASSSSAGRVSSGGRYTNGAAAAASAGSPRRLVFPLSMYQLLLSRVLQARHFSAVLANNLVQQFLLPCPDLRFYFLLVVRKILDSQQQQQVKALLSLQQQQEAEEEVIHHVARRQWYRWPAAVGPEAAAQRMYTVLAALPAPEKVSEKKSRRSSHSSSSGVHGEAGNSSSSSDSDGGLADSVSVSGSESSSEGSCSTSSCGSSSSSSSDEEGDHSGEQQRQQRKKKRWKTARLQEDRETADYASKSCYLLNINTRRCCDPSEYRRLLERVWLQFLRCSASVWGTAKLHGKSLLHHLLLTLPRALLPYMSNPLLLADFFLEAFDVRRGPALGLGSSRPQSESSSSSSNGYLSMGSPCSSSSSKSRDNVDTLASQQRASSSADKMSSSSFSSALPSSPSSSSFISSGGASGGSAAATSTAFSEEAVLALSGLFYLLTQHRLGDPDALWESDGVQQQQPRLGETDAWRYSPSDGEAGVAEGDSDNETDAPDSGVGGGDDKKKNLQRRAAATAIPAAAAAVGRGGEGGDEDATAVGSAGAASDAAAVAAPGRDAGVAAPGGSARGGSSSSSDSCGLPRAAAGGAHMHFYGRLYELLTPAAFFAVEGKARRRFLRLLSLALRSPLLPTHLVASFLKKCCRVACLVPPGGAVYLAGLVFMLLRKHAAVCSALIDVPLALAQELVVQGGDPFDYNKLSLQQHAERRHCSGKREEAETHAKRVRYTPLGGEELSVSGGAPAAAAAEEQKKREPPTPREEKPIKNGEAVAVAGDSETGGREEKEPSKELDTKEVAQIAEGTAALYGVMPRADLPGFVDTQEQKLFELVLKCAPRRSEEPVCQAEGTAGVMQGALLATECMKNQAQTALWELELLRLHYDPAVRQFVSMFDVTFSSSSATGKRARAAAAMAATLDPEDYCWLLDGGAMLQHECKVAAKKSAAAAPPVASGANLPPPDVLQLASATAAW